MSCVEVITDDQGNERCGSPGTEVNPVREIGVRMRKEQVQEQDTVEYNDLR